MITSNDYSYGALNTPLRGGKKTHFEGGIRVLGLLWTSDLPHKGEIYTGLMHAVDWLPTIASYCNISTNGTFKLDGVDMWDSIVNNKPSPRNKIVHNILQHTVDKGTMEEVSPACIYRYDNWKLIAGFPGPFTEWVSEDKIEKGDKYGVEIDDEEVKELLKELNINEKTDYYEGIRLYDIENDPTERNNIALEHVDIVKTILKECIKELDNIVPAYFLYNFNRQYNVRVPESDPSKHNGIWEPWADDNN